MKKWLMLLFLITSFYQAADAEDVFDLAAFYNSKKKNLVGLEAEKRKILSEIYNVEIETSKIVDSKAELDLKKASLDKSLKQTSKKIVEIEKNLKSLTPELTQRLSFTSRVNRLPWVYTLLTAQRISDLDQIFSSAKRINQQQIKQVGEFIRLMEQLEIKNAELKKLALSLIQTRKDIRNKELKISSNQLAKKAILKRLEKKIKAERVRIAKIKKKGRRALAQSEFKDLGLLFGMDFFDKKGKLPRPVSGNLVQGYGLNALLSHDQVSLVHKGHFYNGRPNDEVKSVAPGRVKYVGKVRGLGSAVVVDHGGRYYSVYSNLAKAKVTQGGEISQGQVIGRLGHQHLQFSVGLYFEIRHFSQPQDPSLWLKPQTNKLANL